MSSALQGPARKRRALTFLAAALALAGVLLIAYPFATDLWAAHLQRGLSNELDGNAGDYARGKLKVGDALTRLEIPSLDVDVVVVEGTTPAALHAGPGTTRAHRCPAPRATSRSRAIARPTAGPSTGSTSSSPETA